MKFRAAMILSLALHLSIFALMIVRPKPPASPAKVFYVDLYSPGSGGGPGPGPASPARGAQKEAEAATLLEESGRVRDLTVNKPAASTLRYPDAAGKRRPEGEKAITVVKNPVRRDSPEVSGRTGASGAGELSTGISAGGGGGLGGPGGGGFFPYAYYVETLRNKISASWYNSLVSPGLRGKFLSRVLFTIQRNGTLRDVRLEQESGIPSLDLSALRAVENAAPFAPLPSDFPSAFLVVHFEFEWEKK